MNEPTEHPKCVDGSDCNRYVECAIEGCKRNPAHSKSEYKRRVALGDPNVLPPVNPPKAQGRDDALLHFLCDLHSHLPEGERPMGWCDFSETQRQRAETAFYRLQRALSQREEGLREALAELVAVSSD